MKKYIIYTLIVTIAVFLAHVIKMILIPNAVYLILLKFMSPTSLTNGYLTTMFTLIISR